jgi:hypothetical protein
LFRYDPEIFLIVVVSVPSYSARCPLVIVLVVVLDWFPRRQIEDDDDHEHDQVISRRFSCRATF